MGSLVQVYNGTEHKFALPLVYALMENKTEESYTKVMQETLFAAERLGLRVQHPQTMSDFELAIINAVKSIFNCESIKLCLFHLCQFVYRRIQSEGLQEQYMNEDDDSIREAARSMCALAFVPTDDVPEVFDEVPDGFISVANYFESTYIRGRKARGRRRAVAVRYAPALWNQYDSVLQNTARTNNASEGWHNRFQLLVGRYHPSFYRFLTDLQKEQADVDYMLRDLSLGKKVKNLPKAALQRRENHIYNIVNSYQEYVDDDEQLEYIKKIGYYLNL